MFENIPKIEKPEFYIDLAIRTAKKIANNKKIHEKIKARRIVESEKLKVCCFSESIKANIANIASAFPSMDQLPVFYKELLDTIIGADKLKIALSRISGLCAAIDKLAQNFQNKVRNTNQVDDVLEAKREMYGRTSSILKKNKDAFAFIEESRKALKSFPSIKTKIPSVCICGFPNVGKSTLLSRLTGSRPEIAAYAFTTKQLMIGNIGKSLQIIDTPGTFNDNIRKMNWLERQSYLAIKHLSSTVVYVFDATETSGFPMEMQESLFMHLVKKFRAKKFIIYMSKTDLEIKNKAEFLKKYSTYDLFEDPEKLKEFLLEKLSK
ncbi:MAG TPA: hypothetical protein HA362_05905 [Nanoarchaeota archaeon]|nr:hypothetical protein [Nanoarchaeota archaeon]